MTGPLISTSWYRVAALKPRIRAHARILRQSYRGEVWYVLQDRAAERSHRFSPAAYQFIGLMDGERTVQQLWDAVSAQLGDGAPTQEEVIRLLGQLHAADALLCDVPPDSLEVFRRYQQHERMLWKRRLWTPLALRLRSTSLPAAMSVRRSGLTINPQRDARVCPRGSTSRPEYRS